MSASAPPSGTTTGLPGDGRVARRVASILLLAYALELAFLVVFRREMMDEGWYLLAARNVWEGKGLFEFMAFMQGPLVPYVHGISQWIHPGVLSGRVFSATLALLGGWATLRLARRIGGPAAEPWAAALLVASPYFLSHFAMPLTYAPASLFLVLGALAAVHGRTTGAAVLAWAAQSTRTSLLPAVLVLGWLAWRQSPRTRADLLRAVTVNAACVAGVYAAYSVDWNVGFYCAYLAHLPERPHAFPPWSSFADTMLLASPLFLPALAALRERGPLRALVLLMIMLFGMHLLPATTAAYYQSMLLPLAAALSAVFLARMRPRVAAALVVALALMQCRGLLTNHALVWSDHGPVERITPRQRAAADIRAVVPSEGAKMWTLSPEFAVESGLDVLRGLEMGFFAVRPDWPRGKCERYHLVNPAMLRDWLVDRVPDVVVVTPLETSELGGPQGPVLGALHGRYRAVKRWENVGQFDGPSFLFVREDAAASQ